MSDQYDIWAKQVFGEIDKRASPAAGAHSDEVTGIIAAGLRGAAIEALEHAEGVVAQAARKEANKERRVGVAGARIVLRALALAIKSPIKGDVASLKKQ